MRDLGNHILQRIKLEKTDLTWWMLDQRSWTSRYTEFWHTVWHLEREGGGKCCLTLTWFWEGVPNHMFSRQSLIYLCLLPILRVLIFRKTFIIFIFSPEVLRVSSCTWRLHFFMITVVRSSTQIRNDRKHLWGTYCSAIYNLL